MRRMIIAAALAVGCWTVAATDAFAQVSVNVPFVRVNVDGPGVYVRAPFVRLFVPSRPAYVYPSGTVTPESPQAAALPAPELAPKPQVADPNQVPPAAPKAAPTLEQFAKTFQPRAGAFDVDVINPVTNQPTHVRFTLPDGTPKNVQVRQNEIEFRYGLRRFVRIEFDKDGAQVVSR
jgi:hypothetical protein